MFRFKIPTQVELLERENRLLRGRRDQQVEFLEKELKAALAERNQLRESYYLLRSQIDTLATNNWSYATRELCRKLHELAKEHDAPSR